MTPTDDIQGQFKDGNDWCQGWLWCMARLTKNSDIDDNDCDVENYAPKMTTSNSSYVYNGCKLDPITFLLTGQCRVLHKPTLYWTKLKHNLTAPHYTVLNFSLICSAKNSSVKYCSAKYCSVLWSTILRSNTVFRLSGVFPRQADRARHTGPSAFQRPINCKFNDQL